ncbi:MAG: SCO family protein [Acidimicrobiales bacterium]|nr:SCO family protein [Acidimicrobiales bacterium]
MTTEHSLHLPGDPGWSRRRFLGVAATGLAAVGLGACSLDRASTPDESKEEAPSGAWAGELQDPPLERPDVTFTDMDGEPFPFLEKTEGKLSVLFFGYTNCPDVCPVFLTTFARAIEAIGTGPGSEAQLLFVGVDVQRDTPDQLKTFLSRINPTFIGLTGSEEVIAEANSAVFNPPIEIEEDTDGDGVYLVGHSSKVFPFTADGVGHRIYPSDVRQQQLVRDLPLLSEGTYR